MMKIKHNVLVSVKTNNKNKLLLKIYELNVYINNIKYKNDYMEFETSLDEYKMLKKFLKSYNFKIKKNIGFYLLLSKIKENKVFILNIIFSLIILYIMSNTIISVRVIHSKKYIRDIVTESLNDYGIKRLSWKKNFNELSKIKEKILEKYPENLEWLEIEQIGMTYVVRVEERIITKIEEEKNACNIISKKDAIIKSIKTERGQELVGVNDYVKAGDILISGDIKFNDEIKNTVCASGEVIGEVWYTSSVKIPINYKKEKYTGKKRYNLGINDYKIFRSRLSNYKVKKKKIFKLFNLDFYLLTEKEISIENKKYSEKEAINKAINLTKEKILLKLSEKESIISQKVLKNEANNSTMYVEVFTTVNEVISQNEKIKREEKEVE